MLNLEKSNFVKLNLQQMLTLDAFIKSTGIWVDIFNIGDKTNSRLGHL